MYGSSSDAFVCDSCFHSITFLRRVWSSSLASAVSGDHHSPHGPSRGMLSLHSQRFIEAKAKAMHWLTSSTSSVSADLEDPSALLPAACVYIGSNSSKNHPQKASKGTKIACSSALPYQGSNH